MNRLEMCAIILQSQYRYNALVFITRAFLFRGKPF